MATENIVKLDVGGTIFKTTKSTLTKFDGFFKTMLGTGVPIAKDGSGAIFIDRDPAHFRLILNYMRDGHLDLPESSEDVRGIQKEAQYYLLDGLVDLCKSGRSEEFVIRHLQSWEEEAAAILNSNKKAVMIISYQSSYPPPSKTIVPLLVRYQHTMDVFSRAEATNTTSSMYFVYDKTNNESFLTTDRYLEALFKSRCPHLL